ncbi:FAD:protein FMN transferase [Fuscibacter oryzae]|uniref:FAD:protein FMN transferase n=1 Tax=Fuscibacter oryzae TaxID=2803939 RepID=A0A8J7MQD2_9RHOB|nr:FAD:protein FMN transferase [Fuscibacter oryzae]MBL4926845.1 FAD:protein FMN transferase [Fuscibacter oryzae]
MKRRRFLQILAASAAVPGGAVAMDWTGQALGAEVSLRLRGGPKGAAGRVLADLPAVLAAIEREFSLYDPQSALSRLNAAGRIDHPSDQMLQLLHLSDDIHAATDGLFDPTVQPLWQALAQGGDVVAARQAIGWQRVAWQGAVQLAPGQALTFNGIAQGFATDLVCALLARHGFDQALVNIGEFAALGGPWALGIEDPTFGQLALRHLTGGAIATSSPMATLVGGRPHILHPQGGPALWSTIAVEADIAALADGLATALVLAPRSMAERVLAQVPGVRRITLVGFDGDLTTLAA